MQGLFPVFGALIVCAALAAPLRGQTKEEEKTPRLEPAQVVSTVDAVYPPRAVNWGTVVVNVTVGASGEIEKVAVVRDFPGFTDAALSAVKRWKFRPAMLDGDPIRSVVPVAFSFAQPLLWRQ